MSAITSLEPRIVWEQFDAITRVPRPSKKEGRIIEFLVAFAEKHGIEYRKDATGNVVMRKPATPGYEDRPGVILQSHMDMVCEKRSDVEFDFERDAIRTRIDGGWVKAEGTTLGADCGIGMAAALAVLLDPAAQHGPLEALFTVDEETGLTGAFGLGEEMLTGLTALGAERGVEFDEAGFAASEPLMRVQLKALVAQRLFDTGAFYRVMNPAQNGAYRRAVEILGGWEHEGAPLLMPEN